MGRQQALQYTMDALEKGELQRGQANVFMTQLMGVRVIESRLPREVRSELMAAVKAGELGHMKKDGMKPEVFFHKNAGADAAEIRARRLESSINALRKVLG